MSKTQFKVQVSVLMPCYNSEKYLVEAVASILNQSLIKFELIIIDDGSTDNTTKLIKGFSDNRIQYVFSDLNRGSYVARNKGLELAQGKYIVMADSDDISHPDRLRVQYDYLESNPFVVAIGTRRELINSEGKSNYVTEEPLESDEIKIAYLRDNCLSQSTLMFRQDLLRKGYRYDESVQYCGDFDFMRRVINSHKVANLMSPLVKYRIHPSQTSSINKIQCIKSANFTRIKQLEEWNLDFSEVESQIHIKLLFGIYLDDKEFKLAEDWLNRLIEHNEKTKRYQQDYFNIFCQRLADLAEHTNELGGWSIEKELLAFIERLLTPGKKILEFGSGMGTEALLRKFNVVSLEHDPHYLIKRAPNHECRYAPIENGWYNREVVRTTLNEVFYDLILIDGPPGNLRKGILDFTEAFAQLTSPIIFDDMDRIEDQEIMETFCKTTNRRYRIFEGNKKSYALCTV